MQSALRPSPRGGVARTGPRPANPTTQFLIAGTAAALVSGSLIATNPSTPSLSDLTEHAVHLTAAEALADPFGVWGSTLSQAFDNLESLGSSVVGAQLPLLTQLGDTLGTPGATIGTAVQDSLQALIRAFVGDPTATGGAAGLVNILPDVFADLSQGDLMSAFTHLNRDFLYDLLIFRPWFNSIPRGGNISDMIPGVAGIPGNMLRNMAEVSDVFADFSTWSGLAKGFLSGPIGTAFQTLDSIEGIVGGLTSADFGGALTEFAEAPAMMMQALFNGYLAPNGSQFSGWLTSGVLGNDGLYDFANNGIIDQLLVGLPMKIASALSTDSGAGEAALGGLLNVDFLTGIFDSGGGIDLGGALPEFGSFLEPLTELFNADSLAGFLSPDMLSGFFGGDMLSNLGDLFNPSWLIEIITAMFTL